MLEVTTDPPGLLDDATRPDATARLNATARLDATARLNASSLAEVVAEARARGARSLTVAAHPTDDDVDTCLGDAGFSCVREMLQLRRPLPADPPTAGVVVRAFDRDLDGARWLEVNRRAFTWHPDQGTWTAADLDRRLAESWFEPDGFLVHDSADTAGIDAFCWTKIHPATEDEPALGEIFVIAVDPDAHGRGLGRAMVLAGLDHLHRRGLEVAMLFVEADNTVGRQLYEALGFVPTERHRWYRLDLGAD